MLGIILDMAALGAIASLLARQNMFDEWHNFVFFACGLVVIGVVLFLTVPPGFAFAAYAGAVLIGMRFVIGASWLGAAIGAALFLGYKIAISAML